MIVNAVRNVETNDEFIRIPKVIAVFLAEAISVLMDPGHVFYDKVASFFLARETLDLRDIPLFYALINTEEHFEKGVSWLLPIITSGIGDETVSPLPDPSHSLGLSVG